MKDQMVQVIFHTYGEKDHESASYYLVNSMSELIAAMRRDRRNNEYACATWINSVGDTFEILIDGCDQVEITGEDGSIW